MRALILICGLTLIMVSLAVSHFRDDLLSKEPITKTATAHQAAQQSAQSASPTPRPAVTHTAAQSANDQARDGKRSVALASNTPAAQLSALAPSGGALSSMVSDDIIECPNGRLLSRAALRLEGNLMATGDMAATAGDDLPDAARRLLSAGSQMAEAYMASKACFATNSAAVIATN